MSNKDSFLKQITDESLMTIDENGKVVIQDPELVQIVNEISLEELENITGGATNYACYGIPVKYDVQIE